MDTIQHIPPHLTRFLMVGQRWNINIQECLDFQSGWEERLREGIRQHGHSEGIIAIDYFIFPPGLFGTIPPFTIGRSRWDNWLIYAVRRQGLPVIDATEAISIAHQNHDYGHVKDGKEGAFKGVEALRNHELAGADTYFNVQDATHVLTLAGLHPALSRPYLWQRLNRQTVLSRFKGTSPLRRIFLRVLIWAWKLFLVCVPFKMGRQLVYQGLAWSEEKQKID